MPPRKSSTQKIHVEEGECLSFFFLSLSPILTRQPQKSLTRVKQKHFTFDCGRFNEVEKKNDTSTTLEKAVTPFLYDSIDSFKNNWM